MPPVSCRDCDSAVYSSAKACPECGARHPSTSKIAWGSLTGVKALLGLAALALIAWIVSGCSDSDPSDVGSSSPTTRAAPATTHRVTATLQPTVTTRARSTTTTTNPNSRYIGNLLKIEGEVCDLTAHLESVNQHWDDRTKGLSETDTALEEAIINAEELENSFRRVQHGPHSGLKVVHTTLGAAVRTLRLETSAMLDGLRSPDTGEARTHALGEAVATCDLFGRELNRAAALLRYDEAPTRTTTTTTTTTTRPTTTTRATTTTTWVLSEEELAVTAFLLLMSSQIEEMGWTAEEAVEVSVNACIAMDGGISFEMVALVVVLVAQSDRELGLASEIIGAGIGAFCPQHLP